ncbi:hypothetical protein N657DRAFT_647299 [Parathielavia appendiculata]|uniref:Uncharacterized protein n=1 Tax=Parathielavia appendiculata TaxID=2587402 RepID=A0AAN6Z2P0_9PEZI|nr:hypothetical protein N657DRAFT_647299 [Parathielavia appendiculata]
MTTYLSRSSMGSIPPSYSYNPQDVELSRFDSPSPSSSTTFSDPPSYSEAASSFHPTTHLQIETAGKSWCSLPLPLSPEPIPVFALHPEDSSSSVASQSTPKYTSIRPERSSGSCYLVASDITQTPSDNDLLPVLATTTYRFGPNRPPRVRLYSPHSPGLSTSVLEAILFPTKSKHHTPGDVDDSPTPEEADQVQPWDEFHINSLGLFTRAVTFRTRLGTFEWRYASRRERHALSRALGGQDIISSLLVLERVTRVARAQNLPTSSSSRRTSLFHQNNKKDYDETIRTTIAHFIRGASTRTPGTSVRDAGNGGRLVMDLRLWEDNSMPPQAGEDGNAEGGVSKLDREMAGVLVVATCLVMLKREVDRRRAQQAAILAGAVGGGGS